MATTALITGGTSGIGRATANKLAQLGVHVVVVGRNVDRGEKTIAEIRKAGGRADCIESDLGDASSARAVARKALDITNGTERANSPVVITASFPGTDGTTVIFNPQQQLDRPALLLANNRVYLASASYCDTEPYNGWVLGYDKASLSQVAVFHDTPDGSEGGIWMSGGGASADQNGNVYVTTGNGTFDADLG